MPDVQEKTGLILPSRVRGDYVSISRKEMGTIDPFCAADFYSNDWEVILAFSHFQGIFSFSHQSSLNAGISSRSQFSSGSSEEASILLTFLSAMLIKVQTRQHILPVVAYGLPSTDGARLLWFMP